MKLKIGLLLSFIFLFLSSSHTTERTKIITGYRTNARLPLISKAPENQGLYYDLYTEAAKRLNIDIEFRRKPKKRLILDLKRGDLDFYPGFTFSKERSEFSFFFPNYLPGGYTIVTRTDFEDYRNIKELKVILQEKTQLVELGGPTFDKYLTSKNIHRVAELKPQQALQMLLKNRADFYIYNESTIRYYIKKLNLKGLKLHKTFFPEEFMLLGFSRKSKYYAEIPNDNFDSTQKISAENFPVKMHPNCLAAKLHRTLKEMYMDGTIQKIYNKYYE
jgi:ABC-type amino acid transport substrate-binding protein